MLLYLAFTIQLFVNHRKKILQFFSNTENVKLNWIRNFLIVYVFLFLLGFFFDITENIFIDLGYKQVWWLHLLNGSALVYLGFMALYTNPHRVKNLNLALNQDAHQLGEKEVVTLSYEKQAKRIQSYFEENKAYENSDLTLSIVAKEIGMTNHEVSQVINNHFGVNFKEYVNRFRVQAIQEKLKDPSFAHLSIFGIAMDCGFNSKATFNRVFKSITGLSPSEYKSQE